MSRQGNLTGTVPDADTAFIEQVSRLAAAAPEQPCVTMDGRTLTRGGLEEASRILALDYRDRGVTRGDVVAIVLPNSIELVVALMAAWRVGATPVPLSDRLGATELVDILRLAEPALVHGWSGTGLEPSVVLLPPDYVARRDVGGRLDPGVVSPWWKGIASGGSTGRPKVIMTTAPATLGPMGILDGAIVQPLDTCVVPGPLSHNGPFFTLIWALRQGAETVFTTGRFDPEGLLKLVAELRAEYLYAVPTMMSRMLKVETRHDYDISSLRALVHMGAPCPPEVKRGWLDWVGADHVFELYTSTEAVAVFLCGGREWLEHPGTVGRPVLGEVQIRTVDGALAAVGEIGRVWVRRDEQSAPPYQYLGATSSRDQDGWESVGDIGRLDEAGYLYLSDRESDMILVGGSNVYPAEVEAAIISIDAVEDVCVIGLPDQDLGQVPHAIIFANGPLTPAEVIATVRDRLTPYKAPRSVEFVDAPIRNAAGKVMRRQLIAERTRASANVTTAEAPR